MYMRFQNLLLYGIVVCIIFALTYSHKVVAEDEVEKLRQDILELRKVANPFFQVFQKVSNLVGPSVVSIVAESLSETISDPHDTAPSPFLLPEEDQEMLQYHKPSFGSGIVIKKTGYILTNLHVIDGFEDDKITVTLHNGDKYDAAIVGKDSSTDLAVLKIACDNLREATFGLTKDIHVGDWVIAIGNPFGYRQTVSAGIVSAIGRTHVTPFPKPFAYENFIQTDAAINPGNSGGPLVNLLGQVIGINSAIATRTGGFQGVGFAISAEIANEVIHDLIEKGRVVRGYLGVGIQDINDELAKYLNLNNKQDVLIQFRLDSDKGAFISEVWHNTPASRGGVLPGDVIVEFNGKKISGADDLQGAIRVSMVDSKVDVKVIRNKREKLLIVEIDKQPKNMSGKTFLTVKERLYKTSFDTGLIIEDLTLEKAEKMGYEVGRGVLAEYVESNSPAERAGIVPGDLILMVGSIEVNSVKEFQSAMKGFQDKGLTVSIRTKANGFVTLK